MSKPSALNYAKTWRAIFGEHSAMPNGAWSRLDDEILTLTDRAQMDGTFDVIKNCGMGTISELRNLTAQLKANLSRRKVEEALIEPLDKVSMEMNEWRLYPQTITIPAHQVSEEMKEAMKKYTKSDRQTLGS